MTFEANNVTLGSAVRSLWDDFDMTGIVRDEVEMRTTREEAQRHLPVRFYPVHDLITGYPAMRRPDGGGCRSIVPVVGQTSEEVPGPLPTRNRQVLCQQFICGNDIALQGNSIGVEYDSLVELITSTISPDSWSEVGGSGAIEGLSGQAVLVVAQTDDVHDKIARLLTELRHMQEKPKPAERPDDETADKYRLRVYTIFATNKEDGTTPHKDLILLIRELIEPQSWDKPMQGYIRAANGKLMIRQTEAAHRRIDRLLMRMGLDGGGYGGMQSGGMQSGGMF